MRQKLGMVYKWIGENVGNIYVFSILSLYPLYFHDYYFDIMEAKFFFFLVATCVFLFLFVITNRTRETSKLIRSEKIATICICFFIICGLITCLLSDYSEYAFWGNAGRYKGWFTYALYGIAFLLLVRVKRINKNVLWAMEVTACLAGILGILNHYSVDIFGFYRDLRVDQHTSFSSTFGNINVFAEYLAVIYVISGVLYCGTEFSKLRYLHLITHIIMVGAILLLSSDSAFFAVILFICVYPILIKEYNEILAYVKLIGVFFSEIVIFKTIGRVIENEKMLNGICLVLRNNGDTFAVALAILVVILLLIRRKNEGDIAGWKKIYTVFLSILIFFGFLLVLLVNLDMIPWRGNVLLKMLHFSDEWGTYRGYLWRHTWEIYEHLPIYQKLFGIGQDSMLFVYELNYEVTSYQITTFDNAHNIYLQMLISHGVIGLLFWLGWIGASLYSGVKKAKKSSIFIVVLVGIIMYGIMGLVGLNMMHVSAIVVILLALCFCDMEKKNNV